MVFSVHVKEKEKKESEKYQGYCSCAYPSSLKTSTYSESILKAINQVEGNEQL